MSFHFLCISTESKGQDGSAPSVYGDVLVHADAYFLSLRSLYTIHLAGSSDLRCCILDILPPEDIGLFLIFRWLCVCVVRVCVWKTFSLLLPRKISPVSVKQSCMAVFFPPYNFSLRRKPCCTDVCNSEAAGVELLWGLLSVPNCPLLADWRGKAKIMIFIPHCSDFLQHAPLCLS